MHDCMILYKANDSESESEESGVTSGRKVKM